MRRHRGNGAGPFPGSLEQPQIWPILWISTLLLSDHNLAARCAALRAREESSTRRRRAQAAAARRRGGGSRRRQRQQSGCCLLLAVDCGYDFSDHPARPPRPACPPLPACPPARPPARPPDHPFPSPSHIPSYRRSRPPLAAYSLPRGRRGRRRVELDSPFPRPLPERQVLAT